MYGRGLISEKCKGDKKRGTTREIGYGGGEMRSKEGNNWAAAEEQRDQRGGT